MRVKNLLKYNRHWEKGFTYPFLQKRDAFEKLKNLIDKRQIIELIGLRRTGKTTILLQIINYLLAKNINPFSILYFTFDDDKPCIDDLLDSFAVQTWIDFKREKIFVILDEIQKLDDFQAKIKIYYDLYFLFYFILRALINPPSFTISFTPAFCSSSQSRFIPSESEAI